ncbi:MAG: Crp/Fnr family transcriptional regulator [Candidatus Aureabacteria bacterium]|nr:Crp/Fnr family transcriptional regulator [Candidatus Auribacterota bacterium]
MNAYEILKKVELFDGLSEQSKQLLSSICMGKKFRKNGHLFLEEDSGNGAFLLASGSIRLYKTTPDGKEAVIKMIQPGEIFAEVTLFEKENYPVSAVCLKESFVFFLPKMKFRHLLNQEKFRNEFIRMLMEKQRYLTRRILYLTARDVEGRFFSFLEEQYGKKDLYSIPISKKDLSSAIGTNPETLSRLLHRLTKEKRISWKNHLLRISRGGPG